MINLKLIGICPIENLWGFNTEPVVWKYFQEIVNILKYIKAKMILNNSHFQKQLKHFRANLLSAFNNSLVSQRNLSVFPSR